MAEESRGRKSFRKKILYSVAEKRRINRVENLGKGKGEGGRLSKKKQGKGRGGGKKGSYECWGKREWSDLSILRGKCKGDARGLGERICGEKVVCMAPVKKGERGPGRGEGILPGGLK